jgi:acetoin utilization deacetylase AcuC-like enzyme
MITVYDHDDCRHHVNAPGHPERPERLAAALQGVAMLGEDLARRVEAPLAVMDQLTRVHPQGYVERILAAEPRSGQRMIEADTGLSPGSGHAALRAAGAACAAVDQVMGEGAAREPDRRAFCATRPPGHHAEPETVMGFCLFSNAAIAAEHARAVHGLTRVAVLDFDVHHGNGTQAHAWDDGDFFYGSSHQMPLFPGTGAAGERGAHGQIVNVPLSPGAAGEAFRIAWQGTILPALDSFAPDLMILSAGFDADRRDPLAQLELEPEDFAWVTEALVAVAERHAQGRVVSLLEGGYDLDALREGVAAHLEALAG